MLKLAAIAAVALPVPIVGVLAFATARPNAFRVRRSVRIDAPPERGGGATNVEWSMHGPSPFLAKPIGVLIDRVRTIGGQFEMGLANLKTLVER